MGSNYDGLDDYIGLLFSLLALGTTFNKPSAQGGTLPEKSGHDPGQVASKPGSLAERVQQLENEIMELSSENRLLRRMGRLPGEYESPDSGDGKGLASKNRIVASTDNCAGYRNRGVSINGTLYSSAEYRVTVEDCGDIYVASIWGKESKTLRLPKISTVIEEIK